MPVSSQHALFSTLNMLIVVRVNKCEYAKLQTFRHHVISLFRHIFRSHVDIITNHNAVCRIVDVCIFTTVSMIMYLGQIGTIGWVDVATPGGHVCLIVYKHGSLSL